MSRTPNPADRRRSRAAWWAAAALAVAVAFPASEGPVSYAAYRASRHRLFPYRIYYRLYSPLYGEFGRPRLGQTYWKYILWWHALAMRHEGELDELGEP